MRARGRALSAAAVVFLILPLSLPVEAGLAPQSPPSPPIRFTNITTSAGLGVLNTALPPAVAIVEDNQGFLNGGKGAAWLDYDRDGLEDIMIGGYRNRTLFRNDGDGTFTDVTTSAGVKGDSYTMGVAAPDFNNDGYPDLVFANWYARCEIFINNGDGTFRNVTSEWGFVFYGPATGISFGDLDGDGWGDLYMGTYFRQANHLWKNLRGKGLEEIGKAAGVQDLTGYTFQTLMYDFDLDGDLDLYDVNDFGPDAIYRNDGNFTFTDFSVPSGVGIKGDGMGGELADINDDGYMDVFITNFNEDHWFLSNGDGTYTESLARLNISNTDTAWGVLHEDFDNDGFVDAFVANGRVLPAQGPMPDRMFRNLGNLSFEDLSLPSGVADDGANRGAATADFDMDGDMDLWVANVLGPSSFYRNDASGGHWFQVKLEGVVSIRDAAGARITLEAGGRNQTREVHLGSSYLCQNSLVQHFGLGSATTVERLTVKWPTGVVQTFSNLSADRRITIQEYEPNPPVAVAPDILVDAGAATTLDGTGSTDDTKIVSWVWSFEGPLSGTRFSGATVEAVFYDPGNYTGTLTVTDAFNNSASASFTLTVRAVGHPLVDAGPNVEVPENTVVSLSATLKGTLQADAYDTTSFVWRIEDVDGPVPLSGRNVSQSFPVPGVYTASVVATDKYGMSGSDSLVIRVIDTQLPLIVADPPTSYPEDTGLELNASLTTDNDPLFGSTGLFYWRLVGPSGQRDVAYGAVVTIFMNEPGPHTIELEVGDRGGNIAKRSWSVLALDITPPIAEGGTDRVVRAGESVTLSAENSKDNDPQFAVLGRFIWNYSGPDGSGSLEGRVVVLQVVRPGTTTVVLHVIDPSGNGGVVDDVIRITVLDRTAPVILPIGPQRAIVGEPFLLSAANVTDNDPAFPATGVFVWTLFEGERKVVLSGQFMNYTYRTPGSWPITLEVSDAAGNGNKIEFLVKAVDIEPPAIQAAVPPEALVGDSVLFNASESVDNVGILSSVWELSGPSGSGFLNGREVRWSFTRPGHHFVNLSVTDTSGNAAGRSFEVEVKEAVAPPVVEPPPHIPPESPLASGGIGGVAAWAAAILAVAAVVGVFTLRRRRQP